MANRPTKDELETMYRSKQVIPHDRLLTLLEKFGYESRRSSGGTSHINVWCPKYPELEIFRVIAGTKKLDSQRIAIKQCLQILEWEEEAQAAGLESAPQAIEEFEIASAKKEVIIPDAYELVQGRNNPGKFLRHRRLPQIATEFKGEIDQAYVDFNENYLNERVKKLDEALCSATKDHDFEMETYPNGTIILMHPCHDVNLVIYPFTPRRENWTVIDRINKAIQSAELQQLFLEDELSKYNERRRITEVSQTTTKERVFRCPSIFFHNESDTIGLSTTPNGYFNTRDLLKFMIDVERKFIASLESGMKARYGYNLEKTGEHQITGTHPFISLKFVLDSSILRKKQKHALDELDLSKKTDREKVANFLQNSLATFDKIRDGIDQVVKNFREIEKDLVGRFRKMKLHEKDRTPEGTYASGQIGRFAIPLGKITAHCPMLVAKSFNGEKKLIPTPNTVEQIENLVKKAHKNRVDKLIAARDGKNAYFPVTTRPANQPLPIPILTKFGPK